jgi:hypothetical protein
MQDIVHFLNGIKAQEVEEKERVYGRIILDRLHEMTLEEVETALEVVERAMVARTPLDIKKIFNPVNRQQVPNKKRAAYLQRRRQRFEKLWDCIPGAFIPSFFVLLIVSFQKEFSR